MDYFLVLFDLFVGDVVWKVHLRLHRKNRLCANFTQNESVKISETQISLCDGRLLLCDTFLPTPHKKRTVLTQAKISMLNQAT